MEGKCTILLVLFLLFAIFLVLPVSVHAQVYLKENDTWDRNLIKVALSAVIFGDIDNDDDLDLALTGENGTYGPQAFVFAKIYENNGTSLEENQTWNGNITNSGVEDGALAFGDIDNDGDLDFILSGVNDTVITKIFINNVYFVNR